MTWADQGIGPILDLLVKTIKAKHIRLQDISRRVGKKQTWLSGVVCRRRHMFLDDFLAVCAVAEIDPVEMLATDGFLKYIKNVPLTTIIDDAVTRHLQEEIAGQDITVRVPKRKRDNEKD
jgi:cyanate lyase